MRALSLWLPLPALVLTPAIGRADTSSSGASSEKPSPSQQRLDLLVPDIPAFTALGVSPSTISRPDNVKDLAAALASGISGRGAVQSGVAIEISPQKLVANAHWLDSPAMYDWLGGLRVSGATNAEATNGTTATYVSIGARYSFGGYQPESDQVLFACLANMMRLPDVSQLEPAPPPPPHPSVPAPPSTDTGEPHPAPLHVVSDAPVGIVKLAGLPKCRALIRAANLASDFALELAGAHVEEALGSSKVSDFHPATHYGVVLADVWVWSEAVQPARHLESAE